MQSVEYSIKADYCNLFTAPTQQPHPPADLCASTVQI